VQHLAIVGFGAIARTLTETLCAPPDPAIRKLSVLVRPQRLEETEQQVAQLCAGQGITFAVHSQVEALLADRPGLVVECAGHGAVAEVGAQVLLAGTDLVVASVGALAERALFDALRAAATAGKAQLIVPAGAVGGLDALGAARLSGLDEVTYTGRKPPAAWKGSDAERRLDLDALTSEAVFFDGTAREAAMSFPKNANVAATVALAGAGLDDTRVRLIADPQTSANTHEIRVVSRATEFTLSLTGRPSPLNPRTSLSTAYSLARVVLNRDGALVI
jgi:aspartate dehydrogenase